MSNAVKINIKTISQDTRSTISMRYKSIIKAVNREFSNIQDDTSYSFYVGSYVHKTSMDEAMLIF